MNMLLSLVTLLAAPQLVQEWAFDSDADLAAWKANSFLADVAIVDGLAIDIKFIAITIIPRLPVRRGANHREKLKGIITVGKLIPVGAGSGVTGAGVVEGLAERASSGDRSFTFVRITRHFFRNFSCSYYLSSYA